MANKESFLKKRLIRDSIIVLGVLSGLAVLGYVLMDYDDDFQGQAAHTQGDLDAMHSEYTAIKNKLGGAYDVQNYYGVYAQNHNPSFTINRDMVDTMLRPIKERYHMATLSITISPLTEVSPDTSGIKLGTLVHCDVKLGFGALTDGDVFGMISTLQRTFPGIVIVHNLTMSRDGELTKTALVDLGQHRITPFVKGEVTFAWIGIRQKPDSATPATGDTSHAAR